MLMSIAQPFVRKMRKHMLYTPSSYRSGAGGRPCDPSIDLDRSPSPDPSGPCCWWRVHPDRTNTTTVREERTRRREQDETKHEGFTQSGRILSLYSMCPINVQ